MECVWWRVQERAEGNNGEERERKERSIRKRERKTTKWKKGGTAQFGKVNFIRYHMAQGPQQAAQAE